MRHKVRITVVASVYTVQAINVNNMSYHNLQIRQWMLDNSSFTSTIIFFQAFISTNTVLHLVTIDFHGQSRLTSQNLSNIVITSGVDPDSLNPDADTYPDPSESGSGYGSEYRPEFDSWFGTPLRFRNVNILYWACCCKDMEMHGTQHFIALQLLFRIKRKKEKKKKLIKKERKKERKIEGKKERKKKENRKKEKEIKK